MPNVYGHDIHGLLHHELLDETKTVEKRSYPRRFDNSKMNLSTVDETESNFKHDVMKYHLNSAQAQENVNNGLEKNSPDFMTYFE